MTRLPPDEMIGAMKRRRTRITVAVVAAVLMLLAAAIYLRTEAPPEVARLLPESDGIVYLNLRPMRAATHFDRAHVMHSPDYQRFIDSTGILFERDLDEVAFALDRMPSADGPNGPVAYSEVFEGHFDGRRMTRYLEAVADHTEQYAGHTIYDLVNEGRIDRVTLLGYDMIAVSNTPSAEQMHSIVDRYRTAALPFSGSSLLAAHYHEVPLLSLAWGIGKIGLPLTSANDSRQINLLGFDLPIPSDATLIASLRWAGSLHLRVEEITPDADSAERSASALNSILSLARDAENAPAGDKIDANLKRVLDATRIEHQKDDVVLTATIPSALLQNLLTPAQNLPTAPPGH